MATRCVFRDEHLRFYATDMWLYQTPIRGGDLFLHHGQVHTVLGLECEPHELDPIGYATGYLVCRPAVGGAPVRLRTQHALRPVVELTAPKCSTVGCRDWATHTLTYDACDPLQELLGVKKTREPVCEPCGTSYVHTNHIIRLNGTLTEGTV